MTTDMVNHPPHYSEHPSGIECIEITELMPFHLGNAFKYVFRAGKKHDAIEDLNKAMWYVNRAIISQPTWAYSSLSMPSPAIKAVLQRDGKRISRAETNVHKRSAQARILEAYCCDSYDEFYDLLEQALEAIGEMINGLGNTDKKESGQQSLDLDD